MEWKQGQKLYARIDYRVEDKAFTDQDYLDHIAWAKKVAGERYFVGGGLANIDGGLALYEAADLQEAREIAKLDPLIERGIYRCDIFAWELKVLSDDSGR